MLEIARVLTRGKCFQPDYTILFTAFDSEEDGSFGSQEFLNKIIVPHFIRQGVNIQVPTRPLQGCRSRGGEFCVPLDFGRLIQTRGGEQIIATILLLAPFKKSS